MRKTLLFLYLLSLGSIAAYGQTRLTQDPKLERQLHESGLIHHPLPLDIENSFEANGWKKEVLQSAPLTRSAGTEGLPGSANDQRLPVLFFFPFF